MLLPTEGSKLEATPFFIRIEKGKERRLFLDVVKGVKKALGNAGCAACSMFQCFHAVPSP